MIDRNEILATAGALVNGQRNQDYGTAAVNFSRIAQGWSVIFGRTVEAHEVALAMDWVKTCRLITSPDHLDSWVDKAGYTALGGEIACE